MAADEKNVDAKVVGKAFKIEINGRFLPCKAYSGGQPQAEKAEASSGSSQFNESTMGHNSISELSVQGYLVPGDAGKILSDAAQVVANEGKNERFTITITELAKNKAPVKTFVYDNCLFTSLDYPKLTAHGGEILYQTATFKPERLTVS